MNRVPIEPRADWQGEVEKWGLLFHTEEDAVYWNESAYYEFTEDEVDDLETGTNELHRICLETVDAVIREGRWDDLNIPEAARHVIVRSWERQDPTLYGRFDLAYDGEGPPKMLEYNADTPTSLLEAAVIQWKWLEARFPDSDQFNSIWEGLVETWRKMQSARKLKGIQVHFANGDTVEDSMTVTCLRDTAQEAGILTQHLLVEEIGWDPANRMFVDMDNNRIWTLFKLYPWEWLIADEFAPQVLDLQLEMQWIEPAWKMILSNKAILAILHERYPGHPNLLSAYLDGPRDLSSYVKKPLLSREGANVTLIAEGVEVSRPGPYVGPVVCQALANLPQFDGRHPVVGSWIIGDKARGIGIRESQNLITDNLSQFVPHLMRD